MTGSRKRRQPLPPRLVHRDCLPELRERLSHADWRRIESILPLFETPDSRASLGQCLERLYPKSDDQKALRSFRTFRSRVNQEAEEAGVELSFSVDSDKRSPPELRRCWFAGPDPTAEKVAEFSEQSVADIDPEGGLASRAIATTGRFLEEGKPTIHFFVSSCRQDAAAARDLLERLKPHLQCSRGFAYDVWSRDSLLVGEDREREIQAALKRSHFGVILLSPRYLADHPSQVDLRRLIEDPFRPVVPIMLGQVSTTHSDLRGLEEKQIFRLKPKSGRAKPKSFDGCAGSSEKERFALELFEEIEDRLERSFCGMDLRESALDLQVGDAGAMAPKERRKKPQILAQWLAEREPELFVEGPAVPTRLDRDDVADLHRSALQQQSRSGLELLLEWVNDPDGPPFFAVLGEYGIGKTTTLKQLTHQLLKRRAEDSSVPLPIFIDLRTYSATIRKGEVPTLRQLLAEILERSWKTLDAPDITPDDIVRMVREEGALIIFDGLDEKLVHLDDHQARQFIRELWRVLPPFHFGRDRRTTSIRGRMILSCRSHYFKTIRDQNSMLTGERRDGVRAEDYRACILLPFNEEQIRAYLAASENVGPEGVEPALDLFASVHDLKELSQRPFLLSLITQQIERLEQRRAEGLPTRGVTLYENLVEEWLNRDDGKHQLLPEDKRRLMEEIAAAMWREEAREWSWERVHEWLARRCAEDPGLQARYLSAVRAGAHTFALLEEDFRTATFVLRPDTSRDGFRFAHTSLQEYFLAYGLIRGLRRKKPGSWDLPLPSPETLDFLGQLLETEPDGPELLTSLGELLKEYRARVSETAFRYWLRAVEQDLPQPEVNGVDLRGAQLEGWEISGRPDVPLNLRGAKLGQAVLRAARFEHVDLSFAEMKNVVGQRAEFSRVRLDGARMEESDFTGAVWRECSAVDLKAQRNCWEMAEWIRSRIDHPGLVENHSDVGAISRCESAERRAVSLPSVSQDAVQLDWMAGHTEWVKCCAWSPDGCRLLTGSDDGTLIVWDARNGRYLLSLNHREPVQCCAWSPDGGRLLSGSSDGTLMVWDARSGCCLLTMDGHQDWVRCCAWSPDGRRLLSGSDDGTLRVWDAQGGSSLLTHEAHLGPVRCCAWSPDGRRLVSGYEDGTLMVWDARSGGCLLTLENHRFFVNGCAWSPDGRRLLSSSSDGTLRVWDARSGGCVLTMRGHGHAPVCCGWSPNGRRLLSGSVDGTLMVWDAQSGSCLLKLKGHWNLESCAWSPDGQRLLSSSEFGAMVWDAQRGDCLMILWGHRGRVRCCAWSPDGRRLLSSSSEETLRVWEARRGACLLTLEGDGSVECCAWSPDGRHLLSGSRDSRLRVWEARGGAACLLTLEGHSGWVHCCAWSPDGRRLLSGSSETLRVWSFPSGECLLTLEGHGSPVLCCGWSPDGRRLLSGSSDGTLRVWDAPSGACLLTLEGQGGRATSCAWSPDGRRLLSGYEDGPLTVWDARSGDSLLTLEGDRERVTCCAWSPDGRRLLSGSQDGRLKVWDARSGGRLLTLLGHRGAVRCCAWSPDGHRLLSSSNDATVRVWSAENGRTLFTIFEGPAESATAIDLDGNRVLWAAPKAWRWLGWRWIDPDGEPRMLPAEHFGPLPGPPTA